MWDLKLMVAEKSKDGPTFPLYFGGNFAREPTIFGGEHIIVYMEVVSRRC